uniref:mannan endo-1,4-beta-mannosidase n=1 Tax=Aegilops tauschii TaxID=37682 RepID=M8CXR5_AEGTA
MAACNGLFVYHILGLASLVAVFYFSLLGEVDLRFPGLLPSSGASQHSHDASLPFVERRGAQLFLEGRPFYINGWHSDWLMDQAVEPASRHRVSDMFRAATGMGLTAYGGKTQYVRWAWDEGVGLTASNDSFFFDPAIRDYFKVYLKALLTRTNHLTGVQYKDDPTILAWELMNEPRCISDPSGNTLQRWIEEMAGYVKSIDRRHLLTVGTEGFYGPTSPPEKLSVNPGHWFNNYGLDFIRNSKISDIDFASVHLYPDTWLLHADLEEKLKFVTQWVSSHFEDGDTELGGKPVVLTEFGLSHLVKGFEQSQRDAFYKSVYDIVHASAKRGGAGAGAIVWQLAAEDMEEYHDGFAIVPSETPSMQKLLTEQSCRLAALRHGEEEAKRILKAVCG